MNMKELTDIKFGTDGWRAITDETFNEENVNLVINSIGKYIFETYGIEKPVLIGYDPRNKADVFSKSAAKTLSEYGFDVYYSSRVVPTPVLAYAAKYQNACAVMFTASHNPPEYLGIKFIPDYAGPASSEITDKIMSNLGKSYSPNVKPKEYKTVDFSEKYFEHIEELIDFYAIRKMNKNIIFDGLYSATIGYFDKLLERNGIRYEALRMVHDPNFGGGMPEPKPKYLKELIGKIKLSVNAAGCANDGDGDRFGFINEEGEYVTPNEIIGILLLHLVKNKKITGALVKTVAASMMLDITAEKLGVDVIETPVGFKHVGEAMRFNDCIIGGEESGGLSIKGHIPEKDGILANLLILEAMAYFKKPVIELQKDLRGFVGCEFYNDRVDFKLETLSQVEETLNKFKQITESGGMSAEKIDYKDGVRIFFGRTNRVLARPSGTEPLMRIYFESGSEEILKNLKCDILDTVFGGCAR